MAAPNNSWLGSEDIWRFRLGDSWTGVSEKYQDSSILGLFTSSPAVFPQLPSILVKQADSPGEDPAFLSPDDDDYIPSPRTLRGEARIHEILNEVSSKYITRMYRRLHEDVSTRCGNRNEGMGMVDRIYLEAYSGGGVQDFMSELSMGPDAKALEEEDVWWIFRCLSRALSVLDKGVEEGEGWGQDHEIVHLDIHKGTVFMGAYEDEQARLPVFKIGNFGEAIDASKYPDQEGSALFRSKIRLLPEARSAPEVSTFVDVANVPVQDCRIGTPNNVWQLGALMFQFITNIPTFDSRDNGAQAAQPGPCTLNEYLTNLPEVSGRPQFHGASLFQNQDWTFSKTLLALIIECLLREPSLRPTTTELQRRTEEGYQLWKGKSNSPIRDVPAFRSVPTNEALVGTLPPPEWAIADDTAIDLMVIASTNVFEEMTPHDDNEFLHYLFLHDLPKTMNILQLKVLLARKLVGKPYVIKIRETIEMHPDLDMDLRWAGADAPPVPERWVENELTDDDQTLEDLGIGDMGTLRLYRKRRVEGQAKLDEFQTSDDDEDQLSEDASGNDAENLEHDSEPGVVSYPELPEDDQDMI